MRFAGRTQSLSPYPIRDTLRLVREIGFDGVELCLEHPDLAPGKANPARARETGEYLDELGLARSVSYHVDYIYDDDRFAETKVGIGLAPAFGAEVFVISGCPKSDRPDEWARMIARTRELVEQAESRGVTLAVEFEPDFIVGDTPALHRLFAEIPSPCLQANLDLGHAFLCDPEPLAAICSLRGRIAHGHVENMAAGIHHHLPPDEGEMDLRAYFAALRDAEFAGLMALDLYDGDYAAIARRTLPLMQAWRGTEDEDG